MLCLAMVTKTENTTEERQRGVRMEENDNLLRKCYVRREEGLGMKGQGEEGAGGRGGA